jgi:adenylosuccinate lyase
MATENIMMEAVKRGGDRQELHERIRVHSMEAGKQVKLLGLANDLIDRIAADPIFGLTKEEILTVMEPTNYIGRAPEQVEEFIENEVKPKLSGIEINGVKVELKV